MSEKQPRSRNESAEGSGNARRRWFTYLSEMDPRLLDISGYLNMTRTVWQRYGDKELSPHEEYYQDRAAKDAKEHAELIGFWVAWHAAGGFDLLEERGWTRATIYRRIKNFKERFGAHPDDFEFGWISLDVEQAWDDEVESMIAPHTNPDDG